MVGCRIVSGVPVGSEVEVGQVFPDDRDRDDISGADVADLQIREIRSRLAAVAEWTSVDVGD